MKTDAPNKTGTFAPLYSRPVHDELSAGAIDYFIQSKRGSGALADAACEDGLFYSDHFLAVFDGATDNSSRTFDGRKGGRVARDLITSVFSALPAESTREEVLACINRAYQTFYASYPELDFVANPHWRPTSTLIWYSFARNELVAIADSKARVDGLPLNTESKLVDVLHSDLRVRVIAALGLDEASLARHDPGRDFIAPLIERQFQFQNNPQAPAALQYWAIDGFPIPPEKLRVWNFAQTPARIELSTDGYEFLPDGHDVAAYEDTLRQLLNDDPQRLRNPSTKGMQEGNVSFDDRTVLIYSRKA